MSQFSLNEDPNIVVKVRFLEKGKPNPISGEDYLVRLYDKDLFDDDFLGEAIPDENGIATISFSHDAFSDQNIIKESAPDFYFVVLRNGQAFYHTKVLENLNIESAQQFISGKGEVVDLGTILVAG
jgi:hypothetical protein